MRYNGDMVKLACPRCSTVMVRRRNPKGDGIFYGCGSFEDYGCQVTWSKENGWRNPHVELVRKSSTRSAGKSKRVETIDALVLCGLARSANDAEEFINQVGLVEALAFLG